MRFRYRVLVAFALLALACGGPFERVPTARLGCAPGGTVDLQAVAATIARLRGVAYDVPMRIRTLDEEAFVQRLRAGENAPSSDQGGHEDFWTAFHFADDGQKAAQAAKGAWDSSVTGFYDPKTDELFLRASQGYFQARSTIPHEIAHGIQRRLGVLPWRATASVDENEAQLAMIEGDANVMAASYAAVEAQEAPGIAVARLRDRLLEVSATELTKLVHLRASVASSPALVRARLFFPYVDGTAFATSLYQSGGTRLLNAVLAHPPVSTEQVLHPQKYLAGELPIPVAPPEVPTGTVVAQGTLGELQTTVYLAQCADEQLARAAAEGWGGDAYTIARDAHGHPANLWSTVWDDEDAAVRFEAALRKREGCAAAGRTPSIVRRGVRVAVVDADADAGFEPDALLDRVERTPPPAPPVGNVVLRALPPPAPRFLRKGRVSAGAFASDELGISVSLPRAAVADVPSAEFEFAIQTKSRFGGLLFAFEPITRDLELEVVQTMEVELLRGPPTNVICRRLLDEYVIRTSAGLADVEEVETIDCRHIVVAFVRACQGNGTVILVGGSQYSEDPVTDWFDAVRVADRSPACTYLQALASL